MVGCVVERCLHGGVVGGPTDDANLIRAKHLA